MKEGIFYYMRSLGVGAKSLALFYLDLMCFNYFKIDRQKDVVLQL